MFDFVEIWIGVVGDVYFFVVDVVGVFISIELKVRRFGDENV